MSIDTSFREKCDRQKEGEGEREGGGMMNVVARRIDNSGFMDTLCQGR